MGLEEDEVLLDTNTFVSGASPQAQGFYFSGLLCKFRARHRHTEHTQKDLVVISSQGAETLQTDN